MAKTLCVGLVFIHSYAYYRGVLRGIRRYVEARPQWLLTSIVPELHARRVPDRFRPDGLIAAVNTPQLARSLAHARRPVVDVAAVIPGLRFPRVGVDNVRVGQLAVAHFVERGLRQLAFLGPPDYLFSIEREAAFCQAARQAGLAVACYKRIARLPYDPLGRRWDLNAAAQRWLRRLPRPVGVFVPNDLWGVQVAQACWCAELRIPEDVAILGVDDDDLHCQMTRPPLSSIVVPAQQIGYEAAALLDRLLAGEKPPPQPILLPPTGVSTRRSTELLAVEDRDVVTAVRFIREHAYQPLRVGDVLREVAVGRRTLERRCHQTLGWGLGEEIQRAHLELARRLLAQTDLPMKCLAQRAGFSGFRHMAVVFRQKLGLSPTAYRRQLRGPAAEAVR
jgi:LacI family transcriptional regulator